MIVTTKVAAEVEVNSTLPSSKRARKDEDGDYNLAEDPAADAGPSTPKRARRASAVNSPGSSSSSKKKEKPVSTHSSTWPESKVPPTKRITKTEAQKQYRLQKADFDSLPAPIKHVTSNAYDSFLYLERDVERKAWQKHGGPEGWEAYLDDLRERHMKRSPGKPFVEPESHRTVRSPAVMIVSFSSSPTRPPPREKQLRLDFREEYGDDWVWDAANKALDNDGYYQQLYHAGLFNTRERLEILRKALPGCNGRLTTLGPYPRRPTTPLPASEPTNALRVVLARVPKKPEDDSTSQDNIDVPVGLKLLHSTSPGEPKEYDWNDETFDDIYRALTRVVQELGVAAWKAARWEVRDKYAECIGGIDVVQDRRGNWWLDSAEFWLSGGVDNPHAILYGRRTKTAAGKEYNESLPHLPCGQ